MKKLSLILAFVLVLTCGVLAACGDETTETSSEAAAESSEAKTESSAAAEDSSEAAVESSAADESSETVDESSAPALAAGVNVAAGKSYVTSPLMKENDEYQYDENGTIRYPDTDDKEMTDGVTAAEITDFWSDTNPFIGFHPTSPDYTTNGGYSYITVDLGEAMDLCKLGAYVHNLDAMNAVNDVSFYVSADGETWTQAGANVTVSLDVGTHNPTVELSETVNAQYVQFRFTGLTYWIFVSEVEAYTVAE